MKSQLLQISRKNEARFPLETKQLRAMWRAGYVTANASYWCKESTSWRTIAESRLGIRAAGGRAFGLIFLELIKYRRFVTKLPPVLCIALSAALCAPASARVGNTLEECIKRYGTPVSGPDEYKLSRPEDEDRAWTVWKSYSFSARGLNIKVIFDNGCYWGDGTPINDPRVCAITYRKSDDFFNAAEVDTLLDKNASGEQEGNSWIKSNDTGHASTRWQTRDDMMFAKLDADGLSLTIWNRGWEDRIRELAKTRPPKEKAEEDFEGL